MDSFSGSVCGIGELVAAAVEAVGPQVAEDGEQRGTAGVAESVPLVLGMNDPGQTHSVQALARRLHILVIVWLVMLDEADYC